MREQRQLCIGIRKKISNEIEDEEILSIALCAFANLVNLQKEK